MVHKSNLYKGEIPITKNVNVVDEFGKEYEATYIKRAKGLVKNGRARFINENSICLACPPINYLEDKIMDTNYDNYAQKSNKVNSAEMIEYAKQMISNWNEEYKGAAPGEFDIDVFNKMTETITNFMETAIKLEALEILSQLPNCDDEANREIATAIGRIVR